MNRKTTLHSPKLALLLLCLLPFYLMAGEKVSLISERDGKVTLEVSVYGKKGSIEKLACDKAMRMVMFRGVAGSSIASRPLISTNEEEAIAAHKKWFDNLYNKDYNRYIISCTAQTPYIKDEVSGKKGATFKIELDVRSLRQSLEEKGIIRKFGF